MGVITLKFRYTSDLHLEFAFDKDAGFLTYKSSQQEMFDKFYDYAEQLVPEHPDDPDSIIILAGDICDGSRASTRYAGFFSNLAARFKYVIWVGGNHEYYGFKLSEKYNERIKTQMSENWPNVKFLNEERFNVPDSDVVILGTTLWTNFNNHDPLAMYHASNSINDYKHITFVDDERGIYRTLRPMDTVKLFQEQWGWLLWSINSINDSSPTKQLVVVTHHAPAYESIPQRYVDKNDMGSHAYASNLPWMSITGELPVAWVHGHIHDSNSYTIDEMKVLSNPYGYIGDHINPQFDQFANFIV